jgi:hypothetical protein
METFRLPRRSCIFTSQASTQSAASPSSPSLNPNPATKSRCWSMCRWCCEEGWRMKRASRKTTASPPLMACPLEAPPGALKYSRTLTARSKSRFGAAAVFAVEIHSRMLHAARGDPQRWCPSRCCPSDSRRTRIRARARGHTHTYIGAYDAHSTTMRTILSRGTRHVRCAFCLLLDVYTRERCWLALGASAGRAAAA